MTTGDKGAKQGAIWIEYEKRVEGLISEGASRSDAQGMVDALFDGFFGRGWETDANIERCIDGMFTTEGR